MASARKTPMSIHQQLLASASADCHTLASAVPSGHKYQDIVEHSSTMQ